MVDASQRVSRSEDQLRGQTRSTLYPERPVSSLSASEPGPCLRRWGSPTVSPTLRLLRHRTDCQRKNRLRIHRPALGRGLLPTHPSSADEIRLDTLKQQGSDLGRWLGSVKHVEPEVDHEPFERDVRCCTEFLDVAPKRPVSSVVTKTQSLRTDVSDFSVVPQGDDIVLLEEMKVGVELLRGNVTDKVNLITPYLEVISALVRPRYDDL